MLKYFKHLETKKDMYPKVNVNNYSAYKKTK